MRILSPDLDPDAFFLSLRRAESRLLLLDYDGTLSPFTPDRDRAYPYPGVREILQDLLAEGTTRVVIVSGRAIDDLIPLLGLKRLPEIWGSHGHERLLPDGNYQGPRLSPETREGLELARRRAAEQGLAQRCEHKPASLAVHTRELEQERAREIHARVLGDWHEIAERCGLDIHHFDGGIELRAPGMDKAAAVNTILEDAPPGTTAAYMGDDLTDEDAFRAIDGRGLSILARRELRPTDADLWLVPPDEVLEFLRRWLSVSGGDK
jgi:trehalose-phosphatase